MKKILAFLLAVTMILALAACGSSKPAETVAPATEAPVTEAPATEAPAETEPSVPVMTHEEYMAAEMNSAVCVETYVQANQSWWNDSLTVYAQSEDGAYFIYGMACSEADAEKLVPGTKIRVNGFKSEWSGEIEITDATFEIIDGSFVAEPTDVTDLLASEELVDHQNELVVCKGMTVVSVAYKNDEPGDDIYVTFEKDGANYEFCVEAYLTFPGTEVYEAVGALNPGDVVDVEGFLYWYNGANTHITKVGPAAMTHEQYMAAELDSPVCVETFVQAKQSWWNDTVTVYAQSEDGAYFLYNMACSKEDDEKLVPGTKIRVNGFKSEWSGEVEIIDATFEIVGSGFVASPVDVTDLLGSDELIAHQNEKVAFKGLTVVSVAYKNNEPGDDIYVTLEKDGVTCEFCVEAYLTDANSDVYAAVGALEAGNVVDIEGFLYWYNGANTHITSVNHVA